MGRDNPPQDVGEALDFDWTVLAFECQRRDCGHAGSVELAGLPRQKPLAAVFSRCVCSCCGTRPATAYLAARLYSGEWHRKRVDFFEGRVLRPTRE